jgi:acetyl-CoA decarbonylase/synthase complex subunit delta
MSEGTNDFIEKLEALFEKTDELVFKDIQLFIDKLHYESGSSTSAMATQMLRPAVRKMELAWQKSQMVSLEEEFPGEIVEISYIRKGGKTVTMGGETYPPYFSYLGKNKHRPIVTGDVFDVPIHTKERPSLLRLSKPVKQHFLSPDVSTNPGLWAKKHVEEYGADLVTLHFIGTDPTLPEKLGGNQSIKQAAKHLEQVLDAVDVPVIIGGSGNHKKDVELFNEIADMVADDRFMLSSAELDTFQNIVPAAKKYDHNVLSWTSLNLNDQRKLNEEILDLGLPKDRIVIDPTCAPLGYGLEYSYSVFERLRLSALKGDELLQMPMSAGTTNAWGAREAFIPERDRPEWGPRAYRGPLWEILTAFLLSIVGLDIAMMLHPGAVAGFKDIIVKLTSPVPDKKIDVTQWITMK